MSRLILSFAIVAVLIVALDSALILERPSLVQYSGNSRVERQIPKLIEVKTEEKLKENEEVKSEEKPQEQPMEKRAETEEKEYGCFPWIFNPGESSPLTSVDNLLRGRICQHLSK